MGFGFGGRKVWNTSPPPLHKANRPLHNGGPRREQKSCEHLGNFKVGQTSLKIDLKSEFSHSNRAHSGCLQSLDLTLVWSHVTLLTFPPRTVLSVSAVLLPQYSPLLVHAEQISSSFFSPEENKTNWGSKFPSCVLRAQAPCGRSSLCPCPWPDLTPPLRETTC